MRVRRPACLLPALLFSSSAASCFMSSFPSFSSSSPPLSPCPACGLALSTTSVPASLDVVSQHLCDDLQLGVVALVQSVHACQVVQCVYAEQVMDAGLLAQQLAQVLLEQLHEALSVQRLECGAVEVRLHPLLLTLQHLLHLQHVDGRRVLVHPLARLALIVRAGVLYDGLLQLLLVHFQLLVVVREAHLHVHADGLLEEVAVLLLAVAFFLDGVEYAGAGVLLE